MSGILHIVTKSCIDVYRTSLYFSSVHEHKGKLQHGCKCGYQEISTILSLVLTSGILFMCFCVASSTMFTIFLYSELEFISMGCISPGSDVISNKYGGSRWRARLQCNDSVER